MAASLSSSSSASAPEAQGGLRFPALNPLQGRAEVLVGRAETLGLDAGCKATLGELAAFVKGRETIVDKSPEGFDIYGPLVADMGEMVSALDNFLTTLEEGGYEDIVSMGAHDSFVEDFSRAVLELREMWAKWKEDPPMDSMMKVESTLSEQKGTLLVERTHELANALKSSEDKMGLTCNQMEMAVRLVELGGLNKESANKIRAIVNSLQEILVLVEYRFRELDLVTSVEFRKTTDQSVNVLPALTNELGPTIKEVQECSLEMSQLVGRLLEVEGNGNQELATMVQEKVSEMDGSLRKMRRWREMLHKLGHLFMMKVIQNEARTSIRNSANQLLTFDPSSEALDRVNSSLEQLSLLYKKQAMTQRVANAGGGAGRHRG